MVKGLKEDELETTDSDKSRNESEIPDSVKEFDLEEPNQLKAKRTRRQPKLTPTRRNQRVEGRQHHNNHELDLGQRSRRADRGVRD